MIDHEQPNAAPRWVPRIKPRLAAAGGVARSLRSLPDATEQRKLGAREPAIWGIPAEIENAKSDVAWCRYPGRARGVAAAAGHDSAARCASRRGSRDWYMDRDLSFQSSTTRRQHCWQGMDVACPVVAVALPTIPIPRPSMTADQFAHLLSELIGNGEDGGLTHQELIAAPECAADPPERRWKKSQERTHQANLPSEMVRVSKSSHPRNSFYS